MNCSPALKEALANYINFRYKLDDTLKEISPNQKFTANQLYSYLTKRGVSPKEIKQSKIFDIPDKDTPAKASTWLNELKLAGNQHHLGSTTGMDFQRITLGKEGIDNGTYKVSIDTIKKPKENAPELNHFKDFIPSKDYIKFLEDRLKRLEKQKSIWTKAYAEKYPKDYQNFLATLKNARKYLREANNLKDHTLLGWNRTHIADINGKKTLVLNEFQSDWAQTERAERGRFNSTVKMTQEELDKLLEEAYTKEADLYLSKYPKDSKEYKNLSKEVTKLRKTIKFQRNKNIIADFPMSEQKHHQYQIVKAIDEAMKHHINRIAIPINRENELFGDAGVTKFYDSLNKKLLPNIRKNLEKQGLRIKISKEDYPNKWVKKLLSYTAKDKDKFLSQLNEHWDDLNLNNYFGYPFKFSFDEIPKNANRLEVFNKAKDWLKSLNIKDNELHMLTIEEIPNKPVNWNIYSLLGALGLGSLANKEKSSHK